MPHPGGAAQLGGDVVAEPVDGPLAVGLPRGLDDVRVVPVDRVDVRVGQQRLGRVLCSRFGVWSYSSPACMATTTSSAPAALARWALAVIASVTARPFQRRPKVYRTCWSKPIRPSPV